MTNEQGYTLPEAQRQIRALWTDRDKLWEEMRIGRSEANRNNNEVRQMLVGLTTQMQSIDESLKQLNDGSKVPKYCTENQMSLTEAQKKITLLENNQSDNDNRIHTLESSNKILKWVAGIATTAVTWLLTRQIWEIISTLPK